MSYATTGELQTRLSPYPGLLLDDEGAFDSDTAQDYLDAASAELDSYAGMRYSTPVATSAACLPMLKNWELTLAEELAHNANVSHGEAPDSVKTRVKSVRESLSRLADGAIALSGATEIDASAGGAAIVDCDPPVMTRQRMGGF